MPDGQTPPTAEQLAAALAAAAQQQPNIIPDELVRRSYRNIEILEDDQGNKGLRLQGAAPQLTLQLWFNDEAAKQIGAKFVAPRVQLPQNGGQPA